MHANLIICKQNRTIKNEKWKKEVSFIDHIFTQHNKTFDVSFLKTTSNFGFLHWVGIDTQDLIC